MLDSYEEGIRQLSVMYPSYWGVILRADDTVRSEEWDALLEEYLTDNPDDEQAWARVIDASAYGGPNASTQMGHWWWAHVGAPCTRGGGGNQPGALVDRLEGVPSGRVADPSAAPPQGSAGRRRGPRGNGPSGGQQQAPPPPPRPQQQQRQPQQAGSKAKPARDRASEVCNLWNNAPNGCKNPCTWGRQHVCRVCGGPHRACDQH